MLTDSSRSYFSGICEGGMEFELEITSCKACAELTLSTERSKYGYTKYHREETFILVDDISFTGSSSTGWPLREDLYDYGKLKKGDRVGFQLTKGGSVNFFVNGECEVTVNHHFKSFSVSLGPQYMYKEDTDDTARITRAGQCQVAK